MADRRIAWLDLAKGGSILMVAVYHATLYGDHYGYVWSGFTPLDNLLTPIRMPLFFAVSGVLAVSAIGRGWRDMLRRRIWPLLYLFALWTLISWLFFRELLSNVLTPEEGATFRELPANILYPTTGLWFVWALAIYLVLARLALPIRHFVLGAAVALAVPASGGAFAIDNFAQNNLLKYAPFFLAAAWFGAPLIRHVGEHPARYLLVGAAAYVALELVPFPGMGVAFGVIRFPLSIAGLAAGAGASVYLARLPPMRRVFAYLGQNTLPIYLAHIPLCAVFAALLAGVAHAPLVAYWSVPVIALGAVAVSLLLHGAALRFGGRWLYAPPYRAEGAGHASVSCSRPAPVRNN